MSNATAMPQASPLSPISHWRSGNPATVIALMLKSQPFRQFDRLAAPAERKLRFAGSQLSDPRDPRPSG